LLAGDPFVYGSFTKIDLGQIMLPDHPLISLASDKSPLAREALFAATANQLLDNDGTPSPLEQRLFSDILVKLYNFARHEIRLRLSMALATADWASVELVRELALDNIEIAQPIISFCQVVSDDILIEIIETRDFHHQMCVADRPCIGEVVTGKLIGTQNASVVGTLARNATAKISANDFDAAIDILREHQDDLDSLVMRHDLPSALIATAYGLAGAQTRLAIARRLPPQLNRRLARLTAFVASDAADGHGTTELSDALNDRVQTTVRDSYTKPTPGSLIAALMRGERDVFFRGLADLLDLPQGSVEAVVSRGDCHTISLVTRAANLNMSLARTVFETLDTTGHVWTLADDRQAAMVWMSYSPTSARLHFASNLRGPNIAEVPLTH
jgi:uncharacterized protein (DUF2336 family)